LLTQLAHKLVAHPQIYDLTQKLAGVGQVQERMRPYLAGAENAVVLDVGSGTGLHRPVAPASAKYIGLDIDPLKLAGLQSRQIAPFGILLGDGTRLCLKDDSVDVALCVFLGHHLSGPQVEQLMGELSRVVRGHVLFLDPLLCPDSIVSNTLWRYDRGSYPRGLDEWRAILDRWFEVEAHEAFAIRHHYLLCWCKPKSQAG
jgi:SAM-dependent methyltransferase